MMDLTPHHAKYFAYDLTRRAPSGIDRLSTALFDAAVDLNPHQIEAALFALQSPLSKGVILADEVGLGKTIEAGIVLCQYWAERKRRLLVICPASIRKQWALELEEKFSLPAVVLDSRSCREARRAARDPLHPGAILVLSFHFANAIRDELRAVKWDLVVIDEAHKLRNAYRPSNKVGQSIRWATEDCRKLLLTATPLQNSLLELYGLSTLIDERLFGDVNAFRAQYASAGADLPALRARLAPFCKRTLRNQVTEYIRVGGSGIPEHHAQRLAAESERHAKATVSRSLEQNSKHFHEAREKLERRADDMVLWAEKALADTKEQIKALRRQARQAATLEEQHQLQEKMQKLERLTEGKTLFTSTEEDGKGLDSAELKKTALMIGSLLA